MNNKLKEKILGKYGSSIEFAKTIGEHEAIVSLIIRGHLKLADEERLRWAMALDCNDVESLLQE